jgi:hypothetical protein
MHFLGLAVALVVLGILVGREERWAVALLVAGPVLLLLALRGHLSARPRPRRPAGPRSIDIEARRIRDLQAVIDERKQGERARDRTTRP